MNICADSSSLQTRQYVFSLGLDDDLTANQIQCLLFCGTLPAILGWSGFGIDDCIQGVLPCAGGDA